MTEPGNNTTLYPCRYLARITIELLTPMHIGSGQEWRESDAGVVRDANGLPAIPGSTLAGVLRSLHAGTFRNQTIGRELRTRNKNGELSKNPATINVLLTDDLFGIPTGARYVAEEDGKERACQGTGSRLTVSWGKIHDQNNRPVDSLKPRNELHNDEVLRAALHPTLRDHVRLNGRGVAEKQGKFDELVVHAGHRFTFELELVGNDDDKGRFESLLNLLRNPELRIGGKTRRGLGAFKPVSCQWKCYDLSDQKGFAEYRKHDPCLEKSPPSLTGWKPTESTHVKDSPTKITLKLTPNQLWMFGGGYDEDTDADSAPVKDRYIRWPETGDKEQPKVEERYYIPGSSLKGALRHRTLFHLYACCGHFADSTDENNDKKREEAENLFMELFGTANNDKTNTPEDEEEGQPGCVWIDDIYLPAYEPSKKESEPQPRLQHHVSIDPFTGGAVASALFNDLPLAANHEDFPQPDIPPITIRIDENGLKGPDGKARAAFKMALDDLCEGRLAIGAHGGRGYGFMKPANASHHNYSHEHTA